MIEILIIFGVLSCGGFIVFIASLYKSGISKTPREHMVDDYKQMEALGCFDETITSGSAVIPK
jgi:hypothetical protein